MVRRQPARAICPTVYRTGMWSLTADRRINCSNTENLVAMLTFNPRTCVRVWPSNKNCQPFKATNICSPKIHKNMSNTPWWLGWSSFVNISTAKPKTNKTLAYISRMCLPISLKYTQPTSIPSNSSSIRYPSRLIYPSSKLPLFWRTTSRLVLASGKMGWWGWLALR